MARPEVTGRSILGDQSKPLVVSVGKAKVLLDCSRDRIYSFIKSGELESYVEGTRRKITMDSIERFRSPDEGEEKSRQTIPKP
jgi:hypothetical protein